MGSSGLIAGAVVGASAVGISIIAVPFVSPAFRRVCIPYVPASEVQIENVKHLLSRIPNINALKPRVIDLGSGDGRIVS